MARAFRDSAHAKEEHKHADRSEPDVSPRDDLDDARVDQRDGQRTERHAHPPRRKRLALEERRGREHDRRRGNRVSQRKASRVAASALAKAPNHSAGVNIIACMAPKPPTARRFSASRDSRWRVSSIDARSSAAPVADVHDPRATRSRCRTIYRARGARIHADLGDAQPAERPPINQQQAAQRTPSTNTATSLASTARAARKAERGVRASRSAMGRCAGGSNRLGRGRRSTRDRPAAASTPHVRRWRRAPGSAGAVRRNASSRPSSRRGRRRRRRGGVLQRHPSACCRRLDRRVGMARGRRSSRCKRQARRRKTAAPIQTTGCRNQAPWSRHAGVILRRWRPGATA